MTSSTIESYVYDRNANTWPTCILALNPLFVESNVYVRCLKKMQTELPHKLDAKTIQERHAEESVKNIVNTLYI